VTGQRALIPVSPSAAGIIKRHPEIASCRAMAERVESDAASGLAPEIPTQPGPCGDVLERPPADVTGSAADTGGRAHAII